MNPQLITTANLDRLLSALASSAEVFVPKVIGERTAWQKLPAEGGYRTTAVRVDHPAKGFFFPAQEGVGSYPAKEDFAPGAPARVIVGVKACDLVALKTYDAVFGEGDVKDEFYLSKRDNTTVIAADCPEPAPFCGCSLLGGKPYPQEGFDLSLAEVEGGYVVEVGSEKGQKIVRGSSGSFSEAPADKLAQREAARGAALDRLELVNENYRTEAGRQELVGRKGREAQWREGVSTCVECGACLFACPTCYCFLLHDYPRPDGGGQRAKAWDACIYGGYHLMAGGGSPRADLVKRFRNRWLHKFDYFVDAFGFESCSGCGRCITGCPGKIDLRKVIKSLEGA